MTPDAKDEVVRAARAHLLAWDTTTGAERVYTREALRSALASLDAAERGAGSNNPAHICPPVLPPAYVRCVDNRGYLAEADLMAVGQVERVVMWRNDGCPLVTTKAHPSPFVLLDGEWEHAHDAPSDDDRRGGKS